MSDKFKFEWVVVEKVERKGPKADVLELPGAAPRRAGTSFGEDVALVAAAPPSEVKPMTVQEAGEEARAGKIPLIQMPLRLIRPKSKAEGAAGPTHDPPWGLADIGTGGGELRGKGVVVAVLDSGIDAGHEAFRHLEGKIAAFNFTGVGPETDARDDDEGHGTHCAGTIFGDTIDGIPVGVAPGVEKVLIGKVFHNSVGGDTNSIVRALKWAQFNGADVISMSLGIDFPGYVGLLMKKYKLEIIQAANIALEAYRRNLEMFNKLSESVIGVPGLVDGSLVVGAAGNESDMPNYTIAASLPANATEFVSVAALKRPADGRYQLAPFSNVGAKLAAPGVGIWSAKPGGGGVAMDGTSMAAPHVAGAACLWIEKLQDGTGSVSARKVIDMLKEKASPLEPGVAEDAVIWGRARAPQ
ncbi:MULTISPECIES: S8 family serine peptidase [Mesorhizobium]|uniref:S8 family serine peptidase n=1 Tax=Mesorhizobium TaxID=68287 RepID=UPI000801D119|nr:MULTISPECIES: S8 family serine peptidase [Mesorhizobium]MUT27351.1 S8 family serine peptidase [Mesorhizobium japonicum]OBQ82363.1 hypothetical protein A9K71_26345 [Mesorhizobium sp. WSM3873]